MHPSLQYTSRPLNHAILYDFFFHMKSKSDRQWTHGYDAFRHGPCTHFYQQAVQARNDYTRPLSDIMLFLFLVSFCQQAVFNSSPDLSAIKI